MRKRELFNKIVQWLVLGRLKSFQILTCHLHATVSAGSCFVAFLSDRERLL